MIAQETTETLRSADGLDLHVRRWQDPSVPQRWTFVVAHGLGEHSGRYAKFAGWFSARGARVYAIDHRGHGLSGGPRGHTDSMEAFVADLDLLVTRARAQPDGPLVLVGHSMGGLIAIAYAMAHPDRIDRAVFSAPVLRVNARVPGWKRALAGVAPLIAPKASFHTGLDAGALSHDPEVVARYRSDPLVHDRITPMANRVTFERGEEYISRAAAIKVPFLLLHGADDRLSDPEGSRRFFAAATAPGRAIKIYPGLFHEIFNEPEQEQVFRDVEEWLERPVGGR
jgi:alpha-beta hydrolase superfamily lysophospholipase